MDPAHQFPKKFDNKKFSSSELWPTVRDCADANDCKHCGKCTELLKETFI